MSRREPKEDDYDLAAEVVHSDELQTLKDRYELLESLVGVMAAKLWPELDSAVVPLNTSKLPELLMHIQLLIAGAIYRDRCNDQKNEVTEIRPTPGKPS